MIMSVWMRVTQATDGYFLALNIAERGILPGQSSAYMDMELSTLVCNSKKKIADEGLSVNCLPPFWGHRYKEIDSKLVRIHGNMDSPQSILR